MTGVPRIKELQCVAIEAQEIIQDLGADSEAKLRNLLEDELDPTSSDTPNSVVGKRPCMAGDPRESPTAPQSPYGMRETVTGLLVLVVGVIVAFGHRPC